MERNLFGRNALLSAVEPELRFEANKKLKVIELTRGDVLYSHGAALENVYFPLSGLIGIVAETTDGEGMNSSLVGREGAVGVFEACGSRRFFAEAAVQVSGAAAVMTAAAYRALFDQSSGIRTGVHRYVEQLMSETRQTVVCSVAHDVEARLSRLILEAIRKSGGEDVLPLTQETLARMLGTQRTTVAEILSRMQRDGILATRRGQISVTGRSSLEARSCTCLRIIRQNSEAIWSSGHDSCEAAMVAA